MLDQVYLPNGQGLAEDEERRNCGMLWGDAELGMSLENYPGWIREHRLGGAIPGEEDALHLLEMLINHGEIDLLNSLLWVGACCVAHDLLYGEDAYSIQVANRAQEDYREWMATGLPHTVAAALGCYEGGFGRKYRGEAS